MLLLILLLLQGANQQEAAAQERGGGGGGEECLFLLLRLLGVGFGLKCGGGGGMRGKAAASSRCNAQVASSNKEHGTRYLQYSFLHGEERWLDLKGLAATVRGAGVKGESRQQQTCFFSCSALSASCLASFNCGRRDAAHHSKAQAAGTHLRINRKNALVDARSERLRRLLSLLLCRLLRLDHIPVLRHLIQRLTLLHPQRVRLGAQRSRISRLLRFLGLIRLRRQLLCLGVDGEGEVEGFGAGSLGHGAHFLRRLQLSLHLQLVGVGGGRNGLGGGGNGLGGGGDGLSDMSCSFVGGGGLNVGGSEGGGDGRVNGLVMQVLQLKGG